jgi:hypothetical protein
MKKLFIIVLVSIYSYIFIGNDIKVNRIDKNEIGFVKEDLSDNYTNKIIPKIEIEVVKIKEYNSIDKKPKKKKSSDNNITNDILVSFIFEDKKVEIKNTDVVGFNFSNNTFYDINLSNIDNNISDINLEEIIGKDIDEL